MKYCFFKKMLSLLLPVCLLLPLIGCGSPEDRSSVNSGDPSTPADAHAADPNDLLCVDLMANVQPVSKPEARAMTDAEKAAVARFAMQLLTAAHKDGENSLISPLSILSALSMTCNGANGDTLKEMENILGLPLDELNACVSSYLQQLPQIEGGRLLSANSIWFAKRSDFAPKESFLQTNADFYGADAYALPFDDAACQQINDWVNKHTDGMIPELIDKIPPEAVMYLINALAFEAEWEKTYNGNQVREDQFTREDGTAEKAEFLCADEGVYLDDGMATGFVKYYKDRQYAFVALLPNEGVSLSEYLEGLDGTRFLKILEGAQQISVRAMIPKFEVSCSSELSDVLSGMGMELAFDEDLADFSNLGTADGNLYINRVLHKTYISLTEQGTRAGAATGVEMGLKGIHMTEKEVLLNRPFVYFLIDCETNLPFFAGTLEQINP